MRLIDADKLMEKIKKAPFFTRKDMELAVKLVNNTEIIEPLSIVVPHAKWIEVSMYSSKCSACGFVDDKDTCLGKFCPECGAYMEWEKVK